MKFYFIVFSMVFLFLGYSFSFEREQPNISIGGTINSYTSISNIADGANCKSVITVNDASGFMVGDYALVIQMQGATINESNSTNFGTITNLNSAGLFEKIEITSISGNDITTVANLLNDYQISGKVQLVSIPQYADAEVTSELTALPWDGDIGGIIALEVTGTLTLQADINASEVGFRGGARSNLSSSCSAFVGITNYYYPLGAWEGEGKGEGVAQYILNKEYGRGAQANGGGSGNDHNSGGGGGAGYGNGGIGGRNLEPSFFGCSGNFPGEGGKAISFTDSRLFLGGGGGAGHDNNGKATDGVSGGGIVYLETNTIITNSFSIISNGKDNPSTTDLDGGGGGGGGGNIFLKNNSVTGILNLEVQGGNGSNTFNKNANRCMGPGGGGGGGIIYTNANLTVLTTDYSGGTAGIVTNSTNGCNGNTNSATSGTDGTITGLLSVLFNETVNVVFFR